ncbi:hypothetical protein CHISP_2100 [Chitinispirillum alkaliphilum]|nr:hypothetical protein CHISP_2100 [Chitinispirillum alkaliphilum]
MRRVERINESLLGLNSSSVDSNKFYSILLDARAADIAENMYDIAEKLLRSEKENAKLALDQLWTLKKNVLNDDAGGTVDMLIEHYQEKMDVLRYKEEHLKGVSKDSRSLLEQKQKSDEEIATVKQQIDDCTKSIKELNDKLSGLKTREQELLLIEQQLKKELCGNESEIVNGLYEIILPQTSPDEQLNLKLKENPAVKDVEHSASQTPTPPHQECFVPDSSEQNDQLVQSNSAEEKDEFPEYVRFPKSVVKTVGGSVIGEYYYDSGVYKNERHYIFNSTFFSEQLNSYIKCLNRKFDQTMYSEMQQMIQDAWKRVTENNNIHFEISTNEILNEKSLKQLWADIKVKSFEKAEWFGSKLKAKLETLGVNYNCMLQEQMSRCVEKKQD